MNALKSIYRESYLSQIISLIYTRLLPALRQTVADSFVMRIWMWFNRVILNSALVKLLFDPEYIADIWYNSFFYTKVTAVIGKLSTHIPAASTRFDSFYIGVFLAAVLLTPAALWSDMFWIPLFGALALFYISRNAKNRTSTVFILVNIILLLFLVLVEFSLPYQSVISVANLLIGIDLFFLISFALRTEEDLKNIMFFLFGAAAVLCCLGFVQSNSFNVPATAVFTDGVSLGEILMLIFPFAFIYPLRFEEKPRRFLYSAFIFIAFLNVISATHSKAAFIGFVVEIVILILSDVRYFPFLVLLMPFGLGSLIENFRRTIYAATLHGNIVTNFINLGRQIWNYGFGVDSKKLMSIFGAAELKSAAAEPSMLNIPYVDISPVYVNIVIDVGAVIMVGFLAYTLRLAHSALTRCFTGDKTFRQYFVAGLATLVAISVSAFFETTLFQSRTMLIYWAMLGVLRAVRIMSFRLDKNENL